MHLFPPTVKSGSKKAQAAAKAALKGVSYFLC